MKTKDKTDDYGDQIQNHQISAMMRALDSARLSLYRNTVATDDELEPTWQDFKDHMADVIRTAHCLDVGGKLVFDLGIDEGSDGLRTIKRSDDLCMAMNMLARCDNNTAFLDACLDFNDGAGEPVDLLTGMVKKQLSSITRAKQAPDIKRVNAIKYLRAALELLDQESKP